MPLEPSQTSAIVVLWRGPEPSVAIRMQAARSARAPAFAQLCSAKFVSLCALVFHELLLAALAISCGARASVGQEATKAFERELIERGAQQVKLERRCHRAREVAGGMRVGCGVCVCVCLGSLLCRAPC